ncbi:MAG TPA: GNAT family protein [Chthonomonadaceae bacterium]|nr:GNAT family protein [Chthonomonadaceae bacterium]
MRICRVDDELELRLLKYRDAERLDALKKASAGNTEAWLYRGSAEEFIRSSLERFARSQGFWAGLWFQQELAGVLGLNNVNSATRCAEIDYLLGPAYRGKGLMTRAVGALVGYAFDEIGLNRIEINPDCRNRKSCAIPERLGFQKEGVLRQKLCYGDHFGDQVIYAMLAEDWKSRPLSTLRSI